jgi:hypothetical protein
MVAHSPPRFLLAELARVQSKTHEIVTIHRSVHCPAVWSDRSDQCTCNVRYAIRRLPKGGKRS